MHTHILKTFHEMFFSSKNLVGVEILSWSSINKNKSNSIAYKISFVNVRMVNKSVSIDYNKKLKNIIFENQYF